MMLGYFKVAIRCVSWEIHTIIQRGCRLDATPVQGYLELYLIDTQGWGWGGC